jgi:hypothetical protein
MERGGNLLKQLAVQQLQDSIVLRDVEGVEVVFGALRFQKSCEVVASVLSTTVKPNAHSKAATMQCRQCNYQRCHNRWYRRMARQVHANRVSKCKKVRKQSRTHMPGAIQHIVELVPKMPSLLSVPIKLDGEKRQPLWPCPCMMYPNVARMGHCAQRQYYCGSATSCRSWERWSNPHPRRRCQKK